jgi:hypothetical protein
LSNPTVRILRLSQLSEYIMAFRSSRLYSREQLEDLGKEIAMQKH